MPSFLDRFRRKPKPAPEPEPVYAPPERGPAEGAPAFNVGDTVRAAGTQQSGAAAFADAQRRPLAEDFVVPDGTFGVVKGVGHDDMFVAFPVVVSAAPWRHSQSTAGPDFEVGDRLKSVGPVPTAYGMIPAGHVASVLDPPTGDTMRVQLMLQFPKADWYNPQVPDLRRWGAGIVDLHGLDDQLARLTATQLVRGQSPAMRVALSDILQQDILRTSEANERFRNVTYIVVAADEATGRFSQDNDGQIVIVTPEPEVPVYGRLVRLLRPIIAHELRHAADWAYRGTDAYDRENPELDEAFVSRDMPRYINSPTELRSYAGTVADMLRDLFPDEATTLPTTVLVRAIQQHAAPIWDQVNEEHRPAFLQRVLKALNQ